MTIRPSSLDPASSRASGMAVFKCFFYKFPLQKRTTSFSLLTNYHLSTCWIPKAFLPNGKRTPLGAAMPGKREKEKGWIQPLSPCSGLLAQSIPGTHIHTAHPPGCVRPGRRMWWLVSMWLWFFSNEGQRSEGRDEECSTPTQVQPRCPGTPVGNSPGLQLLVTSQ